MRLSLVIGMVAITSASAFAQSSPAMSLEDVLLTEAYSVLDRRASLDATRTKDAAPDVWWHSGYLRSDNGWTSYEESIRDSQTNQLEQEYDRLKRTFADHPTIHHKLAKWCLENDRPDQYRAHMQAAAARNKSLLTKQNLRRMGFKEFGGSWLSPETVYELAKQRAAIDRSLAEWGPSCRNIREGLTGNARERSLAEKQLKEIDSPNAVLAIDTIFGTGAVECQRLAVNAFSRIDSVLSSRTLAKYAVFSPHGSVRQVAIESLTERRKEDFVPEILDLLATETTVDYSNPARSITDVSIYELRLLAALPPLAFHIKVERDTRRHTQVFLDSETRITFESRLPVFDSYAENTNPNPPYADFRISRPLQSRDGILKLQRAKDLHETHKLRLDEAIRVTGHMNVETSQLNNRVYPILQQVANEQSDDPEFWWKWWDTYTDVDAPVREVIEVAQAREQNQVTFAVASSCFVAGTPIVTALGLRHVETLQIGDQVLSQDVDTGELRFRVVEQTTIRPARPTVWVSFGAAEPIRCTGGHNFWKAGTGWTKARDLKPGDRIRTPTKTCTVSGVQEAAPAKTYNLVVEGFHTYFVGESGLLVQDVLPLTPTDMVLPGLSRFELEE